ncbi:hypothetical protein E2C01_012025 [Portunus trituberculatus]|uniref:Uncharacterized protein n=1 Tax=Portunus trituberculatus TaxID=210409 RepID=A0A5B7DD22_PORTR|nr:hypothetical protein [Portunus trituberculatus]
MNTGLERRKNVKSPTRHPKLLLKAAIARVRWSRDLKREFHLGCITFRVTVIYEEHCYFKVAQILSELSFQRISFCKATWENFHLSEYKKYLSPHKLAPLSISLTTDSSTSCSPAGGWQDKTPQARQATDGARLVPSGLQESDDKIGAE